jgi:FkbM family methyltransferase
MTCVYAIRHWNLRGVRRVQFRMVLRWIVAKCPRKCLRMANSGSIERVRTAHSWETISCYLGFIGCEVCAWGDSPRAMANADDKAMRFRWLTLFLGIPQPVWLPFGSRWIARNDACGRMILRGHFENTERRFVEQFLKPGMVVLDIGAHHGYYSLLASQKVGALGRVIAFEPSLRERRRLLHHLRINACTNVQVEEMALGETEGPAQLYVVRGRETGCNSLRPPEVRQSTDATQVRVARLDDYVRENNLPRVDFVKMDVEGGELAVLKGATEFLARHPRPVIFCEVQDMRTRAWGYPAREIVDFLRRSGFRWYLPSPEGATQLLPLDQMEFDGNFVAVPEERGDKT